MQVKLIPVVSFSAIVDGNRIGDLKVVSEWNGMIELRNVAGHQLIVRVEPRNATRMTVIESASPIAATLIASHSSPALSVEERSVQAVEKKHERAPDRSVSSVLLRLPAVIARVGLSRSEIYRQIRLGNFPSQLKLGGRAVAWEESAIEQWIADLGKRPAARVVWAPSPTALKSGDERMTKITSLLKHGWTVAAVVREMKVPRSTVYRIKAKLK